NASACTASTPDCRNTSFTVTAEDANNNVATNYTGTVMLATSNAGGTFPGGSSYAFTAADAGVHTFQFRPVTKGSGSTITATDGTINGSFGVNIPANPTTINVTAPINSFSFSAINTPTATAGVQETYTLTELDACGNQTSDNAGDSIAITSSDAQATITDTNFTVAGGQRTGLRITFKTVGGGTQTITATDATAGVSTQSQA